jgi:hypothetical protein
MGRAWADLQDLHLGATAFRFQLGQVGGLASLAVAACEPVVRQPSDRRPTADEGASSVLDVDESLPSERRDRLAYGPAGSAVGVDQLSFGWELRPIRKLPCVDGGAEVIGDLEIRRPVAGGIDAAAHACSASTVG